MTILDRYVLTKFLVPFLYCFIGFIAIWFIFDLADNMSEFLEGRAGLAVLTEYYLSQLPEVIVMSLPVGMLLALLYSLTQMSRSNEIISMLGAGRSVSRVLLPLYVVGLVLAAATAYFNFEGAPHAAATKKEMIREIRRGEKRDENLSGHLFRNREDHRTWFARKVWIDSEHLTQVTIIQQDEDANFLEMWYANIATFDEERKVWVLNAVRHATLDERGDIANTDFHVRLEIEDWSETPWRVASSVMDPDYLSVTELRDYLHHNHDFPEQRLAPFRTHLHYRWALPMVCLLVVFLAAPMGIVYSRRGILGGVAIAIGLFFSLVFFSSLSIALGKGARVPPWVAAWGPLIVYFGIGFWLLWYRSTNRDLPKIRMPWT